MENGLGPTPRGDAVLSVECPNCEATFQLAPDRAGKSLRCPECREVFTVPSPVAPEPPNAYADEARTVAEGHAPPAPTPEPEFAPISLSELAFDRVESDNFGPPEVEREAPIAPRPKPAPPRRKPVSVPVARRVAPSPAPPAPEEPAGPREVSWSEGVDAPPPAPAPLPVEEELEDEAAWLAARRPKNRRPKGLLVGLAVALVAVVGVIGFNYVRFLAKSEERAAEEADAAYAGGNMAAAQKRFGDLLREFPTSPARERYQFTERWAGVRAAVDAVEAKSDPDPAKAAFDQFLSELGNSPFAQPRTGVGADVVGAGRKLAELFAEVGEARLKAFQSNRPAQNTGELDAAKRAVEVGESVLPALDKFRDKESAGFAETRQRFAAVLAGVDLEERRLATLAPYRAVDRDPTDQGIEQFRTALESAGLLADAEAQAMLGRAQSRLRELIGSVADARPPQPAPAEPFAASLFVAAVQDSGPPSAPPGAATDVVFAAARGVLYALDALTGQLLWGCPVGENPNNRLLDPLPVRVPQLLGGADAALVLSDGPTGAGLSARMLRTGSVVWHQPLEASPAGRPIVVGQRVYVPLTDPAGTIVEVQLGTGVRLSQSSIRQPIGSAAVALPAGQPGSGLLIVPADARRLFVFAVGREGPDGRRLPPRCVRILATDHPNDSLRGEPLLLPAGPESPARLILAQVDGPAAMKLRSVPLPDPEAMIGAADAPAGQELPAGAAELPVAGWSWFPPMGDGERVVTATDSGAVAVFGLTPGLADEPPLYAWPPIAGARPADDGEAAVSRSLVVAVDDDSAWVIAAGKLQRYRTAVDAVAGRRLVADGPAVPVGEPLARAAALPAFNVAVVVTRPADGSAAHATAFDPRSGFARWKVQLGAVAAGPAVVPAKGPALLVDEAAGVSAIPEAGGFPTPILAPLDAGWSPARYAASDDGEWLWVVAAESGDGRRMRARCVRAGEVASDIVLPLPAAFAGAPVVVGDAAVLPLADGRLFRVRPGEQQGTVGPPWRGGSAPAGALARLTALGPDTFLAGDGDRQLTRWRWPATGEATRPGTPWESRDPFVTAAAVVRLADGTPRYAVADAAGAVRLYDPEQPPDAARVWREEDATAETLGVAGGRVVVGRQRRELAGFDPDAEGRAWLASVTAENGPELLGWTSTGGEILTTDQLGRVAAYDAAGGTLKADAAPPGVFAQAPARRRGGAALLPLADGRVARLPLAGP